MKDFSLIIPVGPPGCGKTSLAALLKNGCLTNEMIVSPDHFREVMTGNRADQSNNGEVFKVVGTIVNSRLRFGLTTYIDATNLTSFGLLGRLGEINGATVYTIRFDDSLEELRERNKNRDHPVPDDVLERMTDAFYDIPMDQFRGTVLSPHQAVELAFENGFAHQRNPHG